MNAATQPLRIDGRDIGVSLNGRTVRITTVSHVNDLNIQQLDTLLDRLADARVALHRHAAHHLHRETQALQQEGAPC